MEFEEYKFWVESTERLSNRRTTLTQMFFAIDAGVLGAIGYIIIELQPDRWEGLWLTLTLSVSGVLFSILWQKIIVSYRTLLEWRYDQLMAMEKNLPRAYKLYTKEWEFLFAGKAKPQRFRRWFGASGIELVLPSAFLFVHLVVAGTLLWRSFG